MHALFHSQLSLLLPVLHRARKARVLLIAVPLVFFARFFLCFACFGLRLFLYRLVSCPPVLLSRLLPSRLLVLLLLVMQLASLLGVLESFPRASLCHRGTAVNFALEDVKQSKQKTKAKKRERPKDSLSYTYHYYPR